MKKILFCLLFTHLSVAFSQSLLTDLRPGMDGSEPDFENAKQRGNELFFVANPDGQGSRLYKTNGTAITLLEGNNKTSGIGINNRSSWQSNKQSNNKKSKL